jgi:hypothetical protein
MSVVPLVVSDVAGKPPSSNWVLHQRRLIILILLLLYLVTVIVPALRVTKLCVTQACDQLLSETQLIQSALIDQGIIHCRVIAHVAPSTHHIMLSRLSIILECHLWAHLLLSRRRDWVNSGGVSQILLVEVVDIFSKLIDFVWDIVCKLLSIMCALYTAVFRAESVVTA